VTIFIDPPTWPGHGRFWSHLISDTSYAELHAFAASVGIPPRAFERDHYDVIAERHEALLAAGAQPASSRDLVVMLHRAGLRRRHRSVLAPALGRTWPRPLTPGDLVAVVSPAGPVRAERLARGIAVLESWGLRVRCQPRLLTAHETLPYLAADDHGRAEDFTSAWTDPEVAAVWAARGGYGAQRMADLVDWSAVRTAGRKTLVGFSDVTALHTRLGRELGQVTIHGPVLGSVDQLGDERTAVALRSLIMDRSAANTILIEGRSAVAGVAQGRLVGGNLSLVAADVGVEPAPETSAVAVFEDVGEDGYRIDRMLTQLLRSRWFDQVTGVVVGEFSPLPGASPDSSGLAAAVITDRLAGLRIPVLVDAPVGHGARNLALPLGAAVTLAAGPKGASGTLSLA
jgi:muramoyltetrapeptide carboxypeptidase